MILLDDRHCSRCGLEQNTCQTQHTDCLQDWLLRGPPHVSPKITFWRGCSSFDTSTGCSRYSLALYSVDTASNVQRAGPFTVVVGSGIFSPAAAPAPSASGAGTTVIPRRLLCMLLMFVVAASLS